MANLDGQEMKMFAKWHGTKHLVSNIDFWIDCQTAYLNKSVTLPLYDEPAEHDAVLAMIKCPPGECGSCCRHYEKIAVTPEEYAGLKALNRGDVRIIQDEKGLHLDPKGGCQFLSNNTCTVYSKRPGVCRSFPILSPLEAVTPEGEPCRQIQIRLECPPALEAIKAIFTRACSTGKLLLLPDLSLIPEYEDGKGILGSI